jgi:inorganic pyrophosphatase
VTTDALGANDVLRGLDFWTSLERLLHTQALVIDRPAGSVHPDHDWIVYPLDYGYLHGTSTVDGGGVDVWRGSGDPRELTAIACTFDPFKRDVEVKLLAGCSASEIGIIASFWNEHEMPHQFLPPLESNS